MRKLRALLWIGGVTITAAAAIAACQRPVTPGGLAVNDASAKVYVGPGEKDEFYMFASGGFSGNVAVYGLPSGRLFAQVPVFSQYPEKGYGYSEQTKALLDTSYGFVPWDDAHHPKVSQTDGVPDGRWLFINGNNTPRIARLDLTKMETVETIEIPNSAGNHASPFVTPNSEYVVAATRFSVPAPQADVPIATAKENFSGLLSFVKVGANGEMSLAFQVRLPGYSYDLAHAGKGPSAGWAFFTTYNTEQAYTLLERGASQRDKDFIAAVNWKRAEECVAQGAGVRTPGKYAHNWVDERDISVNEMK